MHSYGEMSANRLADGSSAAGRRCRDARRLAAVRHWRASYDDSFAIALGTACYVYRACTALFMRVLGTASRAGDERARH